jgi:hypothetical protein
MIGDWPETGERIDTTIHSDLDEDIYATEREHPETHSPVRKVDQIVVNTGLKEGVKTYIVPAPLICELWPFLMRKASSSRHSAKLVEEQVSLPKAWGRYT